ncbi:uncharacterized protein LOC116348819 [Contarinia nasturtii]|uniref:uncharacterized protein LOC116348819 n=1 Tax=Contarinia nasturtii TaxID=265458 RepID=UPI0012D46E61|nr:uncharacterized protein LOC116348819 [Contarinia nasturtii]
MWKYVGQSIKDSVELCSHLKNLRSTFSTFNNKTIPDSTSNNNCDDGKPVNRLRVLSGTRKNGRIYNVWTCLEGPIDNKKNPFDIDTPHVIQKCYQKQKKRQQQQSSFDALKDFNLIQWTAGLLTSLYFSQMICLYSRKRANLKRWTHIEELLTERSLRQAIESKSIYQRSFVPSNDEKHWYDAKQMRQFQSFMPLTFVTNDHSNQIELFNTDKLTSATQTVDDKINLNRAVDDLIATLGSIEFQLGMQNLRAEEPEAAVSHLKLATTHRHPEATFNLGVCYELGVGVEKSMKNAMECYRAAASLGHKTAMYNLGVFYVHGRGGLKKNRDAARACFEAASRMGLRQAKKALTIPETPINKKDEESFWKSTDMMANKLSAVHRRRESSVI